MKDIIIGIDPDIERDGVAILHPKSKLVSVHATTFGKTLNILQQTAIDALAQGSDFIVVIEAGWKNKGNFHLTARDTRPVIAAKGVAQGRNHQRGIDIQEYCEYNHIPYKLQTPLRKCWRGHDRKITQAEIERFMGKLRTTDKNGRQCMPNQEQRDAALLAWNESGLPIRL